MCAFGFSGVCFFHMDGSLLNNEFCPGKGFRGRYYLRYSLIYSECCKVMTGLVLCLVNL